MNKTDGDPEKKGGAYAPKGVKTGGPKRPTLPVDRVKPKGGWPTSIKTTRHSSNGRTRELEKAA